MKFLSVLLTLSFTCLSHAEVKRVRWLDDIKGIEYIDVERVFKEQNEQVVPIRDLVASNPPKTGTAYRVRVIKWMPDGKIQAIWTYQLKHKDGNYEFQSLKSSKTKIDVGVGDSIIYYTTP